MLLLQTGQTFGWVQIMGWYNSTVPTLQFIILHSSLPLNKIRSVALVNTIVWVGTFSGGGLAKFDGVNWTIYTPSNSSLPNNSIAKITPDQLGNIWICTGSGLSYFDGINFTNYNTGNSGLPNALVYDVKLGNNNEIWIASNGGLTLFDGVNWTTYNSQNSNLPLNLVRSINYISDNEIWVGTKGQGVSKFDFQNNTFTNYSISNSNLPNAYINCIQSQSNDLWIATDFGLVKK
jgi:ligand-binding sensor domain-containing protein